MFKDSDKIKSAILLCQSRSSVLLYTQRLLGTGSPGRSPRPLHTETVRDGQPRTVTSTFTQLLSSDVPKVFSKNNIQNSLQFMQHLVFTERDRHLYEPPLVKHIIGVF